MTPIEKLQALEKAATPGPWQHLQGGENPDDGSWAALGPIHERIEDDDGESAEEAAEKDAALMAALRNLAPELIALWNEVDKFAYSGRDLYNALCALNAKAKEVLGCN